MFVAILVVAVAAGCATGAKKPTDTELIQGTVDAFKTALLAKDLDKVMPMISENFNDPEIGNKAGMRDFLQRAIDAGYLNDAEMDFKSAQIKIEGDTATDYPVTVSSSSGSATIGFTLKKEKAGWLITQMAVEGV